MTWLRPLATVLTVLGLWTTAGRLASLHGGILFDDAAFMAQLQPMVQGNQLDRATRHCLASFQAPLAKVISVGLHHAHSPPDELRQAVAKAQDGAVFLLRRSDRRPLWFGVSALFLGLIALAEERRRGKQASHHLGLVTACVVVVAYIGIDLRAGAVEASLRTNSTIFIEWLEGARQETFRDLPPIDAPIPNPPPADPDVAGPLLRVTALTGPEAGKVWTSSSDSVRIGSSASADVRLTDPDVGELHAVVSRDGTDLVLMDLGTAAGTLLGSERVGVVQIDGEETVRLGATDLRIERIPSR